MPQSVSMNLFRNNLKKALVAQGMTHQQLADAAGVRRTSISKILSGIEGVSLDRADRLAQAVGIPLSDLISSNFKILKQSA